MKRQTENYRSRKSRKRALHLSQFGHEGVAEFTPMPNFATSVIDTLKKTFGSSKHRMARMARFKARNR